jgi:hypothetical protein
MRLFIGDDWAEDHHDVEVMDAAGKVLAKARLPEAEAIEALARMHKTLIWDRTRPQFRHRGIRDRTDAPRRVQPRVVVPLRGGTQRLHLAVTPGRYASRGWRTKSPSPARLTIMPSPFSISSARAATRWDTW